MKKIMFIDEIPSEWFNECREVGCDNLDDFLENAQFGHKWQDEDGRFHYKFQLTSDFGITEAVSVFIDEDGEVHED